MAYNIQGTFYEACDCEIICSCWAQIEPDMGQCTGLWAWEITQGTYTNTDDSKVTLDGVKVVILSQGTSCDDAVNKLVIIDADDAQYEATKLAVTDDAAWKHVFSSVASEHEGFARGTINFTPDSSSDNPEVSISISTITQSDPSVIVTHVIANTLFEIDDEDSPHSKTQIKGSGRLINAVLGAGDDAGKEIDVGRTQAKPDPDISGTSQGLNLLAEIPGYTFDLDIIRASAARGKFHYVNKPPEPKAP